MSRSFSVIALWLLGACTSASTSKPPTQRESVAIPTASAPPVVTSPERSSTPEPVPPIVDELVALHLALLVEPLTVDDVARRFGPIRFDHGPHSSVELTSSVPWASDIRVARHPGMNVYLVELKIVGAQPTMAELAKPFGEPHRAHGLHGEQQMMFYPKQRGAKWSVALIASAAPCRDMHSAGDRDGSACVPVSTASPVLALTFRRDPVDDAR